MADESGRNRADELAEADVEAAAAALGLPLLPGAAARILPTARVLQGAARRVHAIAGRPE